MLQIQPDKEIIIEFIKNDDYKYVRLLGEQQHTWPGGGGGGRPRVQAAAAEQDSSGACADGS
jgi:hypothetical protein